MKYLKKIFNKFAIEISIITIIVGIFIILIFILLKPFNDWTSKLNSELFAQYGNFIGGIVGTLFSLVAVFLLYKTLITQQETLAKQEREIKNQKKTFEIERFEATFFNLLRTQQEIAEGIKSYFYTLDNHFAEMTYTVHGREFFLYSKGELTKIWKSIENNEYLGTFDEENIRALNHELDELFNPESSEFINKDNAKYEEKILFITEKLKLTNRQYRISKSNWEQLKNKTTIEKLKSIYGIYFNSYHYVIGHYFRHLYHIIKFINDFENSDKKIHDNIAKKYVGFVQAQMSSFEMMLLFYNAIAFPKLLKYIIEYNFLENLAEEDLIDEKHNCIDGIKLKKRKDLLIY